MEGGRPSESASNWVPEAFKGMERSAVAERVAHLKERL